MLYTDCSLHYLGDCSVLLLDFCDGAAVILSSVFYLLKQVALSFVGRDVVQN